MLGSNPLTPVERGAMFALIFGVRWPRLIARRELFYLVFTPGLNAFTLMLFAELHDMMGWKGVIFDE